MIRNTITAVPFEAIAAALAHAVGHETERAHPQSNVSLTSASWMNLPRRLRNCFASSFRKANGI